MDYTPKYKIRDIVQCCDLEDHIVVYGEIEVVHSFEDKPAIYVVKQMGTNDTYPFTESRIAIAKVA
jgi:flavin reductase (DIM6/NTAB) family NADH-FMN oxidoreductase RutF|tara:strand:- start:1321 stop:1518 length:198 start_codon:yes stop_codon:yes gene_type:complete